MMDISTPRRNLESARQLDESLRADDDDEYEDDFEPDESSRVASHATSREPAVEPAAAPRAEAGNENNGDQPSGKEN